MLFSADFADLAVDGSGDLDGAIAGAIDLDGASNAQKARWWNFLPKRNGGIERVELFGSSKAIRRESDSPKSPTLRRRQRIHRLMNAKTFDLAFASDSTSDRKTNPRIKLTIKIFFAHFSVNLQ